MKTIGLLGGTGGKAGDVASGETGDGKS